MFRSVYEPVSRVASKNRNTTSGIVFPSQIDFGSFSFNDPVTLQKIDWKRISQIE